ncbi:MAG: superoxide dismutase family protein [Alphaproteobacteria bacterium]|nr:superoxide dismutase family protein [Alphaproteobacteria bacterium]MBL6938669.1 superoxide dismutase family protein [Alphaproteobacteria bacterium]MBL7097974.1 superoxide dismutase family protein [Alphaproteobacteria bacterium]
MKRILAGMAAAALIASGPAVAAASKARAIAKLTGIDGQPAGTVSFAATSHGVLMVFDLKGLTPGAHGIHIHTSGSCDPKVVFTSAGPHFSDDAKKLHGYLAEHGMHAGDLPNQFAASDGTLHATAISNAFSLGNGKKSIFDRDGASIIVTAKPDNYLSQPDGGSGERVACGVIMRTVAPGSAKRGSNRPHK